MIKKLSSICILIFSVLFLLSCDYYKEKDDHGITYQLELDNDSQGLNDLVRDYTSSGIGYYLFSEDQVNIYARKNLNADQRTIEYYQYSDEQLIDYYHSLFDVKMLKAKFRKLRESKENLFHPVEDQ